MAALPLLVAASSGLAASERLMVARQRLDQAIERIEEAHTKATQSQPGAYLDSLTALRAQFQQAGDFEGVMAVKEEEARFRENRTLSGEQLGATHPALHRLRQAYQAREEAAALDRAKALVHLFGRYDAHLLEVQTELTRADRLTEAKEVNAELERAATDPRRTAAQFLVSLAESERTAAESERPAVEVAFPAASPGVAVHAPGQQPASIYGLHLAAVGMRATPASPSRPAVDVTVRSGSLRTYTGGFNVVRSYMRVGVSARDASATVKAPLLVVHYFAREVAQRNKLTSRMPRLMETFFAHLPDLSTSPAQACFGPIPPAHGTSGYPAKWRQHAICGVAVMLYARDGSLLYQAVSEPDLVPYVKKDLSDQQ